MIKKVLKPLIPEAVRKHRLQKKHRELYDAWLKNGKPVPPPHIVKQMAITEYQARSNYQTLVETGTYMGDMIEAQKENFSTIYSIELSEDLFKKAVKRFKQDEHVAIIKGDSEKMMPEVLKKVTKPAIFWLDGHYSAGPTARGDKDCPIYGELDAIFENKQVDHIILIDDARDFNGTHDYPSLDELEDYLKTRRPNYQMEVKDDIIRLNTKPSQ